MTTPYSDYLEAKRELLEFVADLERHNSRVFYDDISDRHRRMWERIQEEEDGCLPPDRTDPVDYLDLREGLYHYFPIRGSHPS